ncbi:MAG TPA: rRNA maturation RNase YbeY [Gammaproteobacteria bacterium]|nr:rRNA maturation RNase YbeY [Gammaproteobacteria bacterium]HAU07319.1 rRNA maturation RNase YbeY [Gammaproteobacteria bacterium]
MVVVDLQIVCNVSVPPMEKIQQWAQAALTSVKVPAELSIKIVDEKESAELNLEYRQKIGPTNILSFGCDLPIEIEPRLLGDLVICAPVVIAEAAQQDKAVMDHWAHMIVHGCLHLLGYDHIEPQQAIEMETREAQILATFSIDNPYQSTGYTE